MEIGQLDQATDDVLSSFREDVVVPIEESPPTVNPRRSTSHMLLRTDNNYAHQQQFGIWGTFFLAYQTLGIVYGDIGTSPLYVLSTVRLDSPERDDFLGIFSIIFWTLTIIALVKYVFVVLGADDHGEGGTFAVYSLLCRHGIGGSQFAKYASDSKLSHFSTNKNGLHSKAKAFLETSRVAQQILLFIVMVGTCMVIGDGVLTPAISVLSAMGGVKTAKPSLNQNVVIVLSCIILLGLFILQRFGTRNVSFLFSPVMIAWFLSTLIIGVYNIVLNYPGVLKALSPSYIYLFFQRNNKNGWVALGATILSITGAEAMFADLGHFNKRSIQVAFTTIVYPSLILTYAGQTAYLIKHPQDMGDAFFKSIPKAVYWPMFVVSTLAAIVASQSLISATFSIIKQSMSLGCFPRVQVVHTSSKREGQIYIPEANYVLMVLCLLIVLGFRDSSKIGNAYGVAVIWVMLVTTFLVALVMLVIWNTPMILILGFFGVYMAVEATYMTAVMNKFPEGGWVPFAISFLFLIIMFSWNYGREKKHAFEKMHTTTSDELGMLVSQNNIQRVDGVCFFYSSLVHGVPPIIKHYVMNAGSLHKVCVITTVRFIPVKTVLAHERYLVARSGFKGLYRCVARYGYMDVIDLKGNELLNEVIDNLIEYVQQNEEKTSVMEVENEMIELENGRRRGTVYVLGKSVLKVRENSNLFMGIIVDNVYNVLQTCCRSAMASLKIPPSNFLEVGMVYEI